ncbi:extracellular solute-binding protein [Micromonospora sp. CPCC 206061]|uniref:extracellular solute-binding protein n=1 Tax=Micromonospora sp. CPCC 206061 TaxID=3122410 RepID=UPI002FF05392
MKIPKLRRFAAAALAVSTALTVAACGEEEKAASFDSITVMTKLFGTAPDPNGELQQAIQKVIGKKLDITWVPNADYTDKLNVTLASNNIPDVIVTNEKSPTFVRAAEAGAFWDLTDKLDKYPNLKPADERRALNSSVNGKIYGIYRVRPLLRSAIVYRKDWAAKLGLQEPQTVDELYQMAKAFTERDPDGNGKKDTYGLIIPKWPGNYASNSPYDTMETWFGAPNGWGERDGKIVPGFATEEFYQANRFMKKWVDEGLINKDFATLDAGSWNDPFVQGKGGIIIDVNVRGTDLAGRFRQANPNDFDKVAMVGNMKRSDGQKFSIAFTGYLDVLAISKQRIRTEEQLDEVLTTLDKLQSNEGSALLTNGIEGRNYKLEDGKAALINQDDPAVKVIQNDVDKAFVQLGTRASVGLGQYPIKYPNEIEQKLYDLRDTLMQEDLKTAVHNEALPVLAPTQVEKGQTLDLIIPDARIKYLSGTITEEQLRAEVKRWYDSGGTQVAQEINDLVSKLPK